MLVISWLAAFIAGSVNYEAFASAGTRTYLFLVLSGTATGISWLCYFKALKLGDISAVTPVERSSNVLTVLLAFIILKESVTLFKGIGTALMTAGTLLMILKKKYDYKNHDRRWIIYAVLSAAFGALNAIFGKIGVSGIESDLATAIRTVVVFIIAWLIVFGQKKQSLVRSVDRRSMFFICLSGITTGATWLCYYRALRTGEACIVTPIDKLSIIPTVAFAYIFLKEKLSARAFFGLCLIVAGTVMMI
ncbi:hypothetical protein SDC9_83362 [bioreactor metagenome]|uniref:EamA domain-containing protein n=1 Tax=bioreactor metagenome TaxID=1076179 RepID=A0A644Z7E4_9ZZZZ